MGKKNSSLLIPKPVALAVGLQTSMECLLMNGAHYWTYSEQQLCCRGPVMFRDKTVL